MRGKGRGESSQMSKPVCWKLGRRRGVVRVAAACLLGGGSRGSSAGMLVCTGNVTMGKVGEPVQGNTWNRTVSLRLAGSLVCR